MNIKSLCLLILSYKNKTNKKKNSIKEGIVEIGWGDHLQTTQK